MKFASKNRLLAACRINAKCKTTKTNVKLIEETFVEERTLVVEEGLNIETVETDQL